MLLGRLTVFVAPQGTRRMQQRWALAADATGWALRLRLPATTARILFTSPLALLVALTACGV
jgi:hypothetical protein